jgi:hypothetical protein
VSTELGEILKLRTNPVSKTTGAHGKYGKFWAIILWINEEFNSGRSADATKTRVGLIFPRT